MKKLILKYSIEFFVILFSISISFFVENLREEKEKDNIRFTIKESLLNELLNAENKIKGRIRAFNGDYIALNSVLNENTNIDSVYKYRSSGGFANPFFLSRSFSPPNAIYQSLVNDGNINLIKSTRIKSLLQETYVRFPNAINEWIEGESLEANRVEHYVIDNYPKFYNKDIFTYTDKTIMQEFLQMIKRDEKLKALLNAKKPAMVVKRSMIEDYVKYRDSLIVALKQSLAN